MRTLRLFADPGADWASPAGQDLATAAEILRRGGTVAFATETVYGLGANALDSGAVEKIFLAKQRPAWDPLIVHIADESMLALVSASVPPAARLWIEHFWPGPLTLLLPRHPRLPDAVTAGRPSVGVRMPSHPVARALIRAAAVPIAAPSANTFGHVSPTQAAHVAADLEGRIDAILDSGETTLGLESTVVDASADPCILYRPGAVTIEQLRQVWPSVKAHLDPPPVRPTPKTEATLEGQPSPGLGLRHYAPRARLVLLEGEARSLSSVVARALQAALAAGQHTGLMLPSGLELEAVARDATVYAWGTWGDQAQLAHRLFAGLRALDQQGVQVILCPLPAPQGLGLAIIDRLRRAARPG